MSDRTRFSGCLAIICACFPLDPVDVKIMEDRFGFSSRDPSRPVPCDTGRKEAVPMMCVFLPDAGPSRNRAESLSPMNDEERT
jgi:hypothetical protein